MANNLIIIPLFIICLIAGFYQLFAISNVVNFSGTQQIDTNIPASGVDPNTYVGSGVSIAIQQQNKQKADFTVEMTTGLIALIIGLTAVGVVAGIRLFSSGLSEFSIKLIYNSTVYYGLWGIFSALSYPFFLAFPLFIGVFGWFLLTMAYSLGYFETTWRTM